MALRQHLPENKRNQIRQTKKQHVFCNFPQLTKWLGLPTEMLLNTEVLPNPPEITSV
jgi:hypothetical protein